MPDSKNMIFDVIVVGVGSMGAPACYQLAKRGVKVLGLEQGSLPSPLATFAGATRVIRLSYTEHPDYVPLLRGAYKLWDELGETTGREFIKRTGAVYLGPPDGYLVGGAKQSAEEHGLKHTSYSSDELGERWPQFQLPEGFVGMHEEQGGYVYSEQSVAAYADLALREGAELRAHELLLSQRVCLYYNTPDGHFIVGRHPECDRAIMACGFSGHGFKFASVMGAVLADLATEGKTDWPIGFLGLSRFSESRA